VSQITIRNLPESVEQAIRDRARERNQSLNRTVTQLLEKALGIKPETGRKRDLSDLRGNWTADEADHFDRFVAESRTIDDEIWKP